MRTTAGAENGQIERISPNGDRCIVMAERQATLRHHTIAGGKIVASYVADGVSELLLIDPESRATRQLQLPDAGNTPGCEGTPDSPLAYLIFSSPTRPHSVYEMDVRTKTISRWAHSPKSVVVRGVSNRFIWYTSSDGTQIPMRIYSKQDSESGAQRVLLTGYGGFGVCMTPEFSPLYSTWLESGGALAFACLRGGGERGVAWHKAGIRSGKNQVVDDLIHAAKWLCTARKTAADRLAVLGHSNGAMISQPPPCFKLRAGLALPF